MTEPSRDSIWKMFDRISPSYDRVNRVLSLGLDLVWRAQLSKHLPKKNDLELIDLATGTGDQLLSLLKRKSSISKAVGVDLSTQMLEVAKVKVAKSPYKDRISLSCQDIQKTQFDDGSFDCATLAFGIRNVIDVKVALKEIHRILNSNGRALILEFSMPKNVLVKGVYKTYLRHLLPAIGGLFSKDKAAYKYLNQTIETFPSGDNFCRLMKESGFNRVRFIPYSLGAVNLYIADK